MGGVCSYKHTLHMSDVQCLYSDCILYSDDVRLLYIRMCVKASVPRLYSLLDDVGARATYTSYSHSVQFLNIFLHMYTYT